MDGWNTSFLLGWPILRGYVSFRECNFQFPCQKKYVRMNELSILGRSFSYVLNLPGPSHVRLDNPPRLQLLPDGIDPFSPLNPGRLILAAMTVLGNTLQGTNISHLRKRNIISKSVFWGDILVPWRVNISQFLSVSLSSLRNLGQ